MKVNKLITQELDIQIDGVTLLSVDEYEAVKVSSGVNPLPEDWFLMPHDKRLPLAVGLFYDEYENRPVRYVEYPFERAEIRPVLIFSGCPELKQGDRFVLFGKAWTVIFEGKALCQESIGSCFYRDMEDCEDGDPSRNYFLYENSNIEAILEGWLWSVSEITQTFDENGIDELCDNPNWVL